MRIGAGADRAGTGLDPADDAGDMTSAASARESPSSRWVGYAACAWAIVFAAAHAYWAAGGCAGLTADVCAAGLPVWFLVYDLMVGVLCVAGAVVALALVRPWGRIFPRRWLLRLAWAGSAVLLLRGGVGLIQDGLILTGRIGPGSGWDSMMLYDPWFVVGGVLFGLTAQFSGKRSRCRDGG